MSSSQLSDELWQRQDPAAARLPWRTRRRLLLSALAALIVVIALPAALHAGAFEPQIRAIDRGWDGRFTSPGGDDQPAMSGSTVSTDVSGTAGIVNAGSSSVRVLDITVAGAGLRFDHATAEVSDVDGATASFGAALPFTLAPDDIADVTLYFQITDCHAVPAAEQLATIRIDSWRGIQTVLVALPMVRHDEGGWAVTSPADPQGISSLRYLADAVCGIGMDAG